jgi:hypothetical protein
MATTLLCIHGRGQAAGDDIARIPERLAAHVSGKKREWLGGLAKGLFAARHTAVREENVVFPFYGNTLADAIRAFEAAGGLPPDLGILAEEMPVEDAVLAETKADALLNAAAALGFNAERELSYIDPAMAAELTDRDPDMELGWGDALRLPVLRAALQFVSRKTGAPAVIIEQFLDDVAYYLEMPDMRKAVLDVIDNELRRAQPDGGDLVVVGHSLGSVVAYDFLNRLPASYRVGQLVTAGSPLGYPVVQKNLLGAAAGRRPMVPSALPDRLGAWLNAYDVLDVVALIHPLAGSYDERTRGQITDTRTYNPSEPHSIVDYLSDPDVAGPIGRSLAT